MRRRARESWFSGVGSCEGLDRADKTPNLILCVSHTRVYVTFRRFTPSGLTNCFRVKPPFSRSIGQTSTLECRTHLVGQERKNICVSQRKPWCVNRSYRQADKKQHEILFRFKRFQLTPSNAPTGRGGVPAGRLARDILGCGLVTFKIWRCLTIYGVVPRLWRTYSAQRRPGRPVLLSATSSVFLL